MEEELKEISGLLENVEQPQQSKFKKYLKLVLPHVFLVVAVCCYASFGAWIFYRLESPNEDRLKKNGTEKIVILREQLVRQLKQAHDSNEAEWKENLERELLVFNEHIYRAFKEQYVRYSDVRIQRVGPKEEPRTKRHRPGKRHDRVEKLWTGSSALFFAATTMATIGYGNIVPATSQGRIACVIFALFGAPLAIITIGDIGKFLSECTIWLYKKMKRLKQRIKHKICLLTNKGEVDALSDTTSQSEIDWDGFVMDKSEVPVLLVFAILLLYIAFGGVLFAFLEEWTYMDAFYYSFISLTTIGFGDIVPENHEYIVLMLIYLGVGLAVTTMCIDLVGIQYIQKIHYFGRKFRGTDLLHLLKRKRMIERRLAMGQGEEILQMYIEHIKQQVPEAIVIADKYEEDKQSNKSNRDWLIDDAIISSILKFHNVYSEKVPSPTVLSIRSYRPPSIYSNSSASARSIMYLRMQSRGGSFAESGPPMSDHCSLSTEPSVHYRQAYWEAFKSPDPSVSSFLFEFPLPSPDYEAIAAAAKSNRRIRSCPSSMRWPPSLPPSPVGLACMEEWDSYIRMLEDYSKPYTKPLEPQVSIEIEEEEEEETIPSSPSPTSNLPEILEVPEISVDREEEESEDAQDEDDGIEQILRNEESEGSTIDFPIHINATPVENEFDDDDEVVLHYGSSEEPIPVYSVDEPPFDGPSTLTNALQCPIKYISKAPPTMVADNLSFIIDGDKVAIEDILADCQWWKQTSASTRFYQSETLRTFHQVTMITCRGAIRGAYRSRTRGGGLTRVELANVYRVARHFSYWRTCHAFHRIVSVISPINHAGEVTSGFRQRIFVQYFWRSNKAADKARVEKEYNDAKHRLTLPVVTDSAISLLPDAWMKPSSSSTSHLPSPKCHSPGSLSPRPTRNRAMSLTVAKPSKNPRLSLNTFEFR